MPNNEFQVLIQAIVDAKDVQTKLNAIKDLSVKIEKVNLDQSAIDSLRNQLSKNGIDVNLVLGNTNQVQAQATKAGQQIGQKIQSGIDNVIQKGDFKKVFSSVIGDLNSTGKEAEKYFQTLASGVSIQEKLGKNNNLESFVVSLKNADGVAEQLRYTLKQIEDDNGNITDRWFEYSGGSINDNGVIKQFKTISTAADNLQIKLEKLKANYSDLNASKAIKDLGHISSLEQQYDKVLQCISNLRNADDNTFASMQTNVKSEIAVLENMVQQFRNAENVSSGLSIANNELEKFKNDSKDYPQITKTIHELDTAISQIGDVASLNNFTDQLKVARSELAKIKAETSATNRIEKTGINISGLLSSISEIQRISPQINGFKTQINGAEVSVQSLLEDISKVNTQSDFSVISTKVNSFTKAAKAAGIAISEVAKNSNKLQEIQFLIDTEKYSTQISIFKQQLSKFGTESGEIFNKTQVSLKQLESAYDGMKSTDGDKRLEYEKDYQKSLETTKNLLTQIKSQKSNELISNGDNRRVSFINELNNYLQKNTAMAKQSKQQIVELINTLNSVDDMTRGTFDNLKAQFNEIDADLRATNKLGLSWTDKFKQAISKFGGWTLATGFVMTVVNKIKNSIVELKEVNNILTEIMKTSDLTASQLKELGDVSFETASTYGRKASDYLSGTKEMYRAGYQNAEQMAELSVLAQAAGDMDATVANDYLIATDAAYKLKGNIEDLNSVLDGQNYVTNRNALSMSDLAEATKIAASQSASSGVSIDKATAAMGTMIATTRQGGEIAARAWKGILMNIQQVKGEVEDGEIIDADSLSKYEKACESLGVSLKEVKNGIISLRDPMVILKELSEAYTSLDEMDARRSNLINAVGGKYRGNQLNALLENWSTYEKMLQEYSEGTGSSLDEAMKSANNWEGSLERLNNTFTDIIGNVADSDVIIKSINGLNDLLEILNEITSVVGSFGTLGAIGGGIFGANGLGLT